ncbi:MULTISPECIES: alpha/beta fold hydrolase [Paenibacillus]|uniref:Alpha/beta hydrolase n=1 Tax=Paenibacillus alvei TaxID=44250 RepID=A0ABT4E784_PAEAL|nr:MULTISPECIES: alpha/beta hydrolase [Paenibacillus]EPY11536.1 alpha/beta hydrolase fold protein [Paenibacillus alvei A6-6i-x]MCY9529584.1 alpha/beta hydrolase [Paenibacillus alvei]SDF79237.1 Pimeloyl-ACP methyl ester carboxylesterase [Paenibacillus sp. cl6col]
MTRIQVDANFTMNVEQQGQGPAVILLHGYCGSSKYWEAIMPMLAQNYRVIAPDLRGHAKSDSPVGAYTIEQMADDVLALADKLELSQFVLLGHSLGGYITLSFAQRYSSRLHGFGLIHSTSLPDTEEGKQNRLAVVEKLQSQGIVPVVDGLIPKLFAPQHLEEHALQVSRAKEIGYCTPPQGAAGAALAMRERTDRTSVLQASELPVLLVAGEHDQIVTADKAFTASGDNISQVTIEKAGHMSMMETPATLADALHTYLANVFQ